MKSSRRVNTAATLQAVYLVWLFLRITTMCNLSVFGLVRGKFPELFAHAQTVDTRPLFPPTTCPGYEAIPISHRFLCNYRLTFHHVAFENFLHKVNWMGAFWSKLRPLKEIEAIMGGGRIFDTGPFFARPRVFGI